MRKNNMNEWVELVLAALFGHFLYKLNKVIKLAEANQ